MWRAMMRCSGQSERDRGVDEPATAQRKGLAADDTGHGQPPDRADRDEDEPQTAAKHDGQHDHEEHVRQRVENVDKAHHPFVDAAAQVTGGRPPGDANHEAHNTGKQRDQERHAGAGPDPDEQVAAVGVGPEPVAVRERRRTRERRERPVDVLHVVGAHPWAQHRSHDDPREQRRGEDGSTIASEPPPRRRPQAVAAMRGPEGAQQRLTHVGSSDRATRRRGRRAG